MGDRRRGEKKTKLTQNETVCTPAQQIITIGGHKEPVTFIYKKHCASFPLNLGHQEPALTQGLHAQRSSPAPTQSKQGSLPTLHIDGLATL